MSVFSLLKPAWLAYNRYNKKPEQLNQCTEALFIQTVQQAYAQVPFYRTFYDNAGIKIDSIQSLDDIKQLPILSKDDIRKHYTNGQLIATHIQRNQCMEGKTTGSSGLPLQFLFSKQTYAHYLIMHLRSFFMIGYRPWHKLAYIKQNKVETPGLGPFFRISNIQADSSPAEKIKQLTAEKPDLLVGYASALINLAQVIKPEEAAQIPVRFIFVNSEQTTEEERQFISVVFNCPVYDEYSCEELWMIASQCKQHNYHLFTDNVWVEFIDSTGQEVGHGETGEIILTSLQSPAMPFIRYRIGDYGIKSTEHCPCGNPFPLMRQFQGRKNDSFTMADGRQIVSADLLSVFNGYLVQKSQFQFVKEFQLVQLEPDVMKLRLVPGPNYDQSELPGLKKELEQLCQTTINWSVELCDKIAADGQIKRKTFISHV